jgi:hypothetical protein
MTNFTAPRHPSTVWMALWATEASRVNGLGTSREQRRRDVTGGLPQDDERVARQQLAVEDPSAVETGGLDVLDETH